jgi:hypothetical protein
MMTEVATMMATPMRPIETDTIRRVRNCSFGAGVGMQNLQEIQWQSVKTDFSGDLSGCENDGATEGDRSHYPVRKITNVRQQILGERERYFSSLVID